MMRQRGGSIINMASEWVSGNADKLTILSKAGMIGLAKSIGKELGSRGVRYCDSSRLYYD